jgi:hypothetical protein
MDARSENLFREKSNARDSEPNSEIKVGIMYRMGEDNKLHRCLIASQAHIILKELDEGVIRRHFAIDITTKKILNVGYQWPTLFKDTNDFCKSCDRC